MKTELYTGFWRSWVLGSFQVLFSSCVSLKQTGNEPSLCAALALMPPSKQGFLVAEKLCFPALDAKKMRVFLAACEDCLAQSGTMGSSLLTARGECSLLNLIQGTRHSLCPDGTSEQWGTWGHHPLATGAPASNPERPAKGATWEESFRCFLLAIWKAWWVPAACQMPRGTGGTGDKGAPGGTEGQEIQEPQEIQEVRRFRRYRRYRRSRSSSSITGTPELPGLSLGLHSRRVPHACMDVLCSLLFTGQWLHLQTGAHRAQILSCPCPCPLCAGGCALPCSVLDAPWPFASLLAAAAPAAWTSAHKAWAFLFLFPLTLMNGLYLNAKAHLFLNWGWLMEQEQQWNRFCVLTASVLLGLPSRDCGSLIACRNSHPYPATEKPRGILRLLPHSLDIS